MNSVKQVQTRAWIKFLKGPLSGTTFDIVLPITTIGRDRSNDITVLDQKVSRFHARLLQDDGAWRVEKLSQTSSVTVNQQSIESLEGTTLSHNALVELGEDSTFLFLLSLDDAQGEGVAQHPPFSESLPAGASPMMVAESILADEQRYGVQHLKAIQTQPPLSVPQGQTAKPPGTEVASLTALGIPSVEITDNTGKTHQKYPLAQRIINIGRDTKNDVVISEQCVSSFHVQIVREGEQYVLIHPHPEQKETANGLLYQGRKIQGDEVFRKPLARGDVFRITDEYGLLVTLTYNDGSSSRQEVPPPTIKPLQLGSAEITFGRLQDNDVVLDHPQVSAHHAQLTREQGSYLLTDLNSTNHTYVNGLQVSSQLLELRDEIRIGPFRFIYTATELTQYDESESIRIDALNLKKVGNNQTILLNDISLSIPARSFVALVGGSGAGKTTLLDALSGLRPAQQGTVFYNGQDYYRNQAAFSSQLGYVPQEDIIHRDLTVERALYYAAKLRLPQDFTEAQIEQRIDEVLSDVEIKHRRSLLISRLSGGQRKRVSIALELLAKPSVFFLDEPTSGLDPGLDRKMMLLLRKLADKGHTIILVTHATNNINFCDYVCFLAAGGNLAYFGPPEEAKAYFGQPEFAEIYSLLDPGDDRPRTPVEVGETFRQSHPYQKYISGPLDQKPKTNTQLLREQQLGSRSQRGNGWRQFFLLTQRYLELLKNDRVSLAILLLQAPIIGLLLLVLIKGVGPGGFDPGNVVQCPSTAAIVATGVYPDVPTPPNPVVSKNCTRVVNFLTNNPLGKAYANLRGGVNKALQDFIVSGPGEASSLLFLMTFAAIMFGCVNAVREIVKEAPIYKRERAVNVGILPYMFSKIVVLGVLCLLQSLILIACVSIFDPFHHSIFLPPFLEVYITLTLTSWSGLMLGLMVSALAPNNDRAAGVVPLLLLPQALFSGAIFPLTNWFLQILGVFFPARWAMVAMSSSVGLHSDKVNGDEIFGNNYSYHGTLFSIYNQGEALQYLLLMWLALIIMILLFGVAVGYFLKRKDSQG